MSFDIDVSAARGRQQRLLVEMRKLDLDLVIVAKTEHVQWLCGPRFGWVYEPLAALWKDGSCTLVAPNEPPDATPSRTLPSSGCIRNIP